MRAGIISYTTMDAQSGNVVASVTGGSTNYGPVTLNFQQFDPSLGLLDSITVSMDYEYSVAVNTGEGGGGGSFGGGGTLYLGGYPYNGVGCDNDGGGAPNNIFTFTVSCTDTSQAYPGADPAILGTVEGLGTVQWQWGDASLFTLEMTDGVSGTATLTSGSATVTYDYSPEPGAGLLTLTGALGLWAARSRFRSNSSARRQ
jgi:hypothetical protein